MLEAARMPTIQRIGVRTFWMLLISELVLIATVCMWAVVTFVPFNTPLTATSNLSIIRDVVWAHLLGSSHDPLIALPSGMSARESNIRGLEVGRKIYYYYVEGNQNFDPFSRGDVTSDQIEVLLREETGPLPLVVYVIR